MPFTLIQGTFKPDVGDPDGDSVRFAPDDTTPVFSLTRRGRPPKINATNGTIQLRYEAIDTMEKSAVNPHAADMTAKNLGLIGYTSTAREPRGYILSSQCDTNGRPICFVFTGTPTEADGTTDVHLDTTRVKLSVNYQLVKAGQAYPLFYDTLYKDLREEFTAATVAARAANLGVWPHDATKASATWAGAASLKTMPPIFPKLWRRLQKYTQDRAFRDVSDTLDSFVDYLQVVNDRVWVISENKFTGLDNLVRVYGSKVALPYNPEDMIFQS